MKLNYSLAISLLILWGCANRVQPTGGPKDEDPPIPVFSSPLPGQLNFKGQEIQIEFNEFIVTKGLKEQLIITPRLDGDYKMNIKKRTLYLIFDQPFKDSTTYTLNFRDGVTDITEKNPVENLLLPFSTGSMLDTLEIGGYIFDLMTKDPVEGATLALYTVDDTLDIFTGSPYYSTKSTSNGSYVFKNLKDDNYKLYAFVDTNKNLTCEPSKEPYAFLPNFIKVDTIIYADTLNMQFLNIDTLEITRTRQAGQYYILQANKYIVNADLQTDNDSILIYKFNKDRKGLKIYNSFIIKDSLKITVTLEDSLGYIINDSFYMSFTKSSRKSDEFKVLFRDPIGSKTKKVIVGKIQFDKPLSSIILDSISIERDSVEQYYIHQRTTYKYDSLLNIMTYSIEIPQAVLDSLDKDKEQKAKSKRSGSSSASGKTAYSVKMPKGTFLSIENDSSEATSKEIKFVETVNSGLIVGNITTSYASFTIQLLDENYKTVKEQINGKSYTFNEIAPGKYHIRILIDENENGKWDPGNIRMNKLPEDVFMYHDKNGNKKTAIRANWELTIDLSF